MGLTDRLRHFSMGNISQKVKDQEKARKTPRYLSFGDGVEHSRPIYKCVYCGGPMFPSRVHGDGTIQATCTMYGCPGNQDTPEIYISAKRKMDDKLEMRNGTWTR